GQPRVLDFGVARLTSQERSATLCTSQGQLIGTLPYMSPEQIEGDPNKIDTRSDVYALGVILFECLTGQLPYDFSQRGMADSVVMVRETAPRRLDSVNATLAGDLTLIMQKALARDREHRYQSAAGLADDLRRYLADEPVSVSLPGITYHLRRF